MALWYEATDAQEQPGDSEQATKPAGDLLRHIRACDYRIRNSGDTLV
jgi:hypothetical protein